MFIRELDSIGGDIIQNRRVLRLSYDSLSYYTNDLLTQAGIIFYKEYQNELAVH